MKLCYAPSFNWVKVSLATALLASLPLQGQTFTGSLTTDNRSDLHTFSIPGNGLVDITVTTGPDLSLGGGVYVRDSEGVSMYSSTQGPGKTMVHSVTHLRAGTYSVEIEKDSRTFYFGAYTAVVEFTPVSRPDDSEVNDAPETAQAVPLDAVFTGHLGFRGQLDYTDMRDYFVFETPVEGTLLIDVLTSGDDGTKDGNLNLYGSVSLYDSDGSTSIYWSSQSPTSQIEHRVPRLNPGRYYLKLEKDSRSFYWGSYSVQVRLLPTLRSPDTEPNDSPAEAGTLVLGETREGLLGFHGQGKATDLVDLYELSVPRDGALAITVQTSGSGPAEESDGALNLYGRVALYDNDGTTSLYSTNQSPGTENTHVLSNLRAGTYFLKLEKDGRSQYWGSYSVSASLSPAAGAGDDEPNGTMETAVPFPSTGQVQGHIGYRGMGIPTDLEDWFSFSHEGGDFEFTVATGEKTLLYGGVYLRNPEGTTVWSRSQSAGLTVDYTVPDLPAGSYYLCIVKDGRSQYYGDYQVVFKGLYNPLASLFPDAQAYAGDWYQSPWLGWFYTTELPLLQHLNHGWIFVFGPSEDNFFFYDYHLGFLWTGQAYYPYYLYDFANDRWLLYMEGSTTPNRWFMDWADYSWFQPDLP